MASEQPDEGSRTEHRSWWQTLPGVLTAFASVITAAAGLIVALNQFRGPASLDVHGQQLA